MRWMPLAVLLATCVGSDGAAGSERRLDPCGACAEDDSTCKIVSGLFTRPTLPVGYNLIARIPRGACNINITELKQSQNYLAIRSEDGRYIINGKWAINLSGIYESSGTSFAYSRHSPEDHSGEQISARGPLTESVDVLVIFRHPNPGIKYEYTIPVKIPPGIPAPHGAPIGAAAGVRRLNLLTSESDPAGAADVEGVLRRGDRRFGRRKHRRVGAPEKQALRHRHRGFQSYPPDASMLLAPAEDNVLELHSDERSPRRWRREYHWKIMGFSDCTQSCGGGTQMAIVLCVKRNSLTPVDDSWCDAGAKPPVHHALCNTQPCPARWTSGDWSPCSVTCGPGTQTREVVCRQDLSPTMRLLASEEACEVADRPPKSQPCQVRPCVRWASGPWGKCSAECGRGVRQRDVWCSADGRPIPYSECGPERPRHEEVCEMVSCISIWLVSEWQGKCSVDCGSGVQRRKVVCSGPKGGEGCDANARPREERPCVRHEGCGGRWFSGPWSECSATCGEGLRRRAVVCMALNRGQWRPAVDRQCESVEKPSSEEPCGEQVCSSEWYSSEWSECSRTCGIGVQSREVSCIDQQQHIADDCANTERPPSRQACNLKECHSNASSISNVQNIDARCTDSHSHCHLVVKSRLCGYDYYMGICCESCSHSS